MVAGVETVEQCERPLRRTHLVTLNGRAIKLALQNKVAARRRHYFANIIFAGDIPERRVGRIAQLQIARADTESAAAPVEGGGLPVHFSRDIDAPPAQCRQQLGLRQYIWLVRFSHEARQSSDCFAAFG